MNPSTLLPLTNETQLIDRAFNLVGTAKRLQLWLMFLDVHDVQSPVLLPTDIPVRPGPRDAGPFSTFIEEVVKAVEYPSIVVVLERPGAEGVTDDDICWFRLLRDSARLAGVELRATLLSHSSGVALISAERFA